MAKALEMLGSNFRNERQTERRNEQLCHSQEEVEYEEHPRSCLESGRLCSREILERLGRRITDEDLAEVMKRLAKDKMLRALSNVDYAKGDYEKEMGQAALLNESLNYRNT